MTRIALLRHFETEWNRQGRIQGRTDPPLPPDAARHAAGRRLHGALAGMAWYASPLRRALQTAALLGLSDPRRDARLMEMDWGEWEGARLAELRRSLGHDMARNEAKGLDFRPPGGESPRELRERFGQWLAEVGGSDSAAVTHKGVIRAALSLALGWDLKGKAPLRSDWTCAHVFELDGRGGLALARADHPVWEAERAGR